ncbi:MAG: hypothetical protein ACKOX3_10845 [Bacteroidota bacterium]
MTTVMKLYRMLNGIFADFIAYLGGGVIVPLFLFLEYAQSSCLKSIKR